MGAMKPGTKRALITIGVDRTGDLVELDAAAKGALEVKEWLGGEGYHVIDLTDGPRRKVRFSDVFDAVEQCVNAGSLETLVVYFAGHGYFSVGSEIWLLSGAPGNPSEAINLAESSIAARGSGLKNVVFIADTCRSVPTDLQGNAVRGGSIFPVRRSAVETQIDSFFATHLGDVALEVAMDPNMVEYNGLFTTALRGLHNAAPADDLVKVEVNGTEALVLPNRRIRKLLPDFFLRELIRTGAVATQNPALRIESDEPFFVATGKAAAKVKPRGGLATVNLQAHSAGRNKSLLDAAEKLIEFGGIPAKPRSKDPRENRKLDNEARAHVAAERKSSGFETRCGIVVSGSSIVEGAMLGGPAGEIEGPGQSDNRYRVMNLHGDYSEAVTGGSAIIRFNEGFGTILAALPGYVATVIVEPEGVVSVSYTPAPNSALWSEYQHDRSLSEQRRAIAATTARHGVLAMDRESAKKFGDLVRVGKRRDPTLGIYAALAYASVGLRSDAASVLKYQQEEIQTNLLDVWLFAGANQGELAHGPLLPLSPMLSQAWDYLRPLDVPQVPEILRGAARRQALWTTFAPEAMDMIFANAREGKLG